MPNRPNYPVVHLVRGLAALLVCLGHLRAMVMVDHAQSQYAGDWLTRLFYFATGFGHAAVIVFFVLSGFLVGGPALKHVRTGSFAWPQYLIQRFTRLYVTLIPALALTALLHVLGHWLAPEAYGGALYERLSSGPSPDQAPVHAAWLFAAHAAFLQGLIAPVWPSNGPLWSLSCEAWFYVLLPLIALALHRNHGGAVRWRHACMAAGATLCMLLLPPQPSVWASGFAVWCCGVAAALRINDNAPATGTRTTATTRETASRAHIGWAVMVWAVILVATRLRGHGVGTDVLLGATTAWALWACLRLQLPNCILTPVRWLSDLSYSLYLVHFPVQFFICATLLKGQQFDWGVKGLAVYAIVLIVSLTIAWLFHLCFEQHTDTMRMWLTRVSDRVVERIDTRNSDRNSDRIQRRTTLRH